MPNTTETNGKRNAAAIRRRPHPSNDLRKGRVLGTARFRLTGKKKNSYLALVLSFPLASIGNDDHLAAAQSVLDRLLARHDLDEGESLYLDALSDLVAGYEDEHHAIAPASDADMLRHLMDAKAVTQTVLHHETGIPKSTISEILAGKKPFSRQIIRKLGAFFNVDVSVLSICE